MPAQKATPAEMPSEDLVLAAIDRAYRHRTNQRNPGVLLVDVKEHLGLDRTGASTVRLRPTWENLQTLGLIEQTHQSNRILWRLTDAGHKRLQAGRQTSDLSLPESPQHRRWRNPCRSHRHVGLRQTSTRSTQAVEASSTDWRTAALVRREMEILQALCPLSRRWEPLRKSARIISMNQTGAVMNIKTTPARITKPGHPRPAIEARNVCCRYDPKSEILAGSTVILSTASGNV